MHAIPDEGLDGDVLVFLPGAAEIRRAAEACAPLAAEFDALVLSLHGELPSAEQDRAVRPAADPMDHEITDDELHIHIEARDPGQPSRPES